MPILKPRFTTSLCAHGATQLALLVPYSGKASIVMNVENHQTLSAAVRQFGSGWMVLSGPLLGAEEANERLLEALSNGSNRGAVSLALTPRREIFDPLARWASVVTVSPPAALSNSRLGACRGRSFLDRCRGR